MTTAFDAWRRDGKTYQYCGHNIFYRDQGEGPVLLAIHGFPSASWDFQPIWSELTARFRVIAADMLGYGWSDKPRPYRYSVVDLASLHRGLLAGLGIERIHILAHDVGVSVAAELLARQQRKEDSLTIDSVCFLNGGVFPETHRPLLVQRAMASRLGPLLAPLMRKRDYARGMNRVFAKPLSSALIDELWSLLMHQDGRRVLPNLLGYIAERRVNRERWVQPIIHPQVPIRLIDGTCDPVSGKTLVARFRELVTNADVVELPHVGHYPHVEDPAAVLQALFAFHDGRVVAHLTK
ncbi:MAG: alpha/beta hydrolase [Myxococcales bacterium]